MTTATQNTLKISLSKQRNFSNGENGDYHKFRWVVAGMNKDWFSCNLRNMTFDSEKEAIAAAKDEGFNIETTIFQGV